MRFFATLSLLAIIACGPIPSTAQEDTAPAAGEASQGSDTSFTDGVLSDSVWFDAETGEIKPVYVQPVTDDSLNRSSRWLPKAKRVAKPSNPTNNAAGGGTGGGGTGTGLFGTDLSFGNVFGWVILIGVIAGAIALLIYAISKTEVDLSANKSKKTNDLLKGTDEQIMERMKHLPKELRRTDVNLRSEAERLMESGEFDQAIILLFGHQLLLLDRVGMLRLNRGKTNRRYVRETRSADGDSANILKSTVNAFERSYFGRHTISSSQFAKIWESNLSLETAVERRREGAA